MAYARILSALLIFACAVSTAADFVSQDIPAGLSPAGITTQIDATDFDIQGSGSDIWNASDEFAFASQQVSGDFDFRARIADFSPVDPWSKVGVMLRASADAGSPNIAVFATSGNGFVMQHRDAPGAGSGLSFGGPNTLPTSWVRIVRVGTDVAGYCSNDGSRWTRIATLSWGLADPALIGMAVTSHHSGVLCTAQFRDVSIQPLPGPVNGFISADINTNIEGSTAASGSTGVDVTSSGNDIWSGADGMRMAYQQFSGNFDIRARVASLATADHNGLDGWSKAGVMVRQSLDPASGNVFMAATGGNGIVFQSRSASGAQTGQTQGGGASYPNNWVRLIRIGQTVTGYVATDVAGQNWRKVDSTALSGNDPVLVGLAVTSHNSWALCQAQFRDVLLQPYDAVIGSGQGLSGTYFDNIDFSGYTVQEVDPVINFDWSSSPAPAIGHDNFSTRWTGQVQAQFSEFYTFYATGDDGIRLWVNGQLVIDQWHDQAPSEYSAGINLLAGQKYDIRLEYYQRYGGAVARLAWSSASTPKEVIPQGQLYPTGSSFLVGTGTGLQAQYYNSSDPSGTPVVSEIDGDVNFNWGGNAPGTGVNGGHFAVRWSGQIQAQYTEAYLFNLSSQGGVRLYVNNLLVIDDWNGHGQTWDGGSITLAAGQKYNIMLEYYDNDGSASAQLYWSSPSTPIQIVPQSQLYPTGGLNSYGSGDGLLATYFNDMDLSGSPALTRVDPRVDFDWNGGIPDPAVYADGFSARWVGQVQPQFSEAYTFDVRADDGVRLWVNDVLVIDQWHNQAPTEYVATVSLVGGTKYDIAMEYYQNTGGAVAQLLWSSPSTPKQVIPQSQLYSTGNTTVVGNGDGLFGQYYSSVDLSASPALTRVDPQINFDWSAASPDAALPQTNFSVRWLGQVQAQYTQLYTFYVRCDDGARLWVGSKLVVDAWRDQAATGYSGTVLMSAGEKVGVRLEYYQRYGGAAAQLSWSSPGTYKQTIPQSQLYSQAGTTVPDILGSPVSPAFIEGQAWSPNGSPLSISVIGNGGVSVPGTFISASDWFANVPLYASNAPTPISIANSATGTSQNTSILWQPTDLSGKDSSGDGIVIRKGDSLLLTASGSSQSSLSIDPDGSGYQALGNPGSLTPFKYNTPGTFVASAKIDGAVVGSFLVTVVDVDLHKPVACQVGYQRIKNVPVNPPAANVVFAPADASSLDVQPNGTFSDDSGAGPSVLLTALRRGTPKLVARIGGTTGPIVAVKEIDEFTIDNFARTGTVIDSSTNVGQARFVMHPYIPDLDLGFAMFAHTSTFAGGARGFTLSTADMQIAWDPSAQEQVGTYTYDIESPTGETMYCMNIDIVQYSSPGQVVGGDHNVNGCAVHLTLPTTVLFAGDPSCTPLSFFDQAGCSANYPITIITTNGNSPPHFSSPSSGGSAASRQLVYFYSDGNTPPPGKIIEPPHGNPFVYVPPPPVTAAPTSPLTQNVNLPSNNNVSPSNTPPNPTDPNAPGGCPQTNVTAPQCVQAGSDAGFYDVQIGNTVFPKKVVVVQINSFRVFDTDTGCSASCGGVLNLLRVGGPPSSVEMSLNITPPDSAGLVMWNLTGDGGQVAQKGNLGSTGTITLDQTGSCTHHLHIGADADHNCQLDVPEYHCDITIREITITKMSVKTLNNGAVLTDPPGQDHSVFPNALCIGRCHPRLLITAETCPADAAGSVRWSIDTRYTKLSGGVPSVVDLEPSEVPSFSFNLFTLHFGLVSCDGQISSSGYRQDPRYFDLHPDDPPKFTQLPNATLDPLNITLMHLSSLAVPGNGGTLIYHWDVTGPDGNPIHPFPNDDGNSGRTQTSIPLGAGHYSFKVTATDSDGCSATATGSFDNKQVLTTVRIIPPVFYVQPGAQLQLSAVAYDQYGSPMSTQPPFDWTTFSSNTNYVDSNGLLTIPTSFANLPPQYGGTSFSAFLQVGAYTQPPPSNPAISEIYIGNDYPTPPIQAGSVVTASSSMDGAVISLGAQSTDSSASVNFNWQQIGGGTGVTFAGNGTNSASSMQVIVQHAGTYAFSVTATNPNNGAFDVAPSAPAYTTVTVSQIPTSIAISPPNASVDTGGTVQYSAVLLDQFGDPIITNPPDNTAFTWSAGGGGTIGADGKFTAGGAYTEPSVVTATVNGISGIAAVQVSLPPIVADLMATPNPSTGTTADLSVFVQDPQYPGDDDNCSLTLNWHTVPSPLGAATFSSNGSSASTNTTATFSGPGNYTVEVDVTNLGGQTTVVQVPVTVIETPQSIAIYPVQSYPIELPSATSVPQTTFNVSHNRSLKLFAVAINQWGKPMYRPQVSWSVTGGGTVSAVSNVFAKPYSDAVFYAGGAVGGPFTLTASLGSVQASDTIFVFDTPPVTQDKAYSTVENVTLAASLPARDPDGDPISCFVVDPPLHGTLTLIPSTTSFRYVPDQDFFGTDSFTFDASDGQNSSNTSTATIDVKFVNHAPLFVGGPSLQVGATDGIQTFPNWASSISSGSSTEANQHLTFLTHVNNPALFSVLPMIAPDGTLSFTPNPDAAGTATVTVQLIDDGGTANGGVDTSASVTFSIVIDAVPDAVNDEYAVTVGNSLSVSAPGVMRNDIEADGRPIQATLVSGAQNGTLVFNSDGSFQYTPAAGFHGADTFSYTVSNGRFVSNIATVTLKVNSPPSAQDDDFALNEDGTLMIPAPGVLANDADPDGDVLTAVLVKGPTHGRLSLNANGSLSYVPSPLFYGTDTFTYQASDGLSLSNAATVTLAVAHVNHAPFAGDGCYGVATGQVLSVAAPGLLTLCKDLDGDPLTVTLVSGPSSGVLALSPDGSFTYQPAQGFVGIDSFRFTANDGLADSNIGTATLNVGSVGSAPTLRYLYAPSFAFAVTASLMAQGSDTNDTYSWALVGDIPGPVAFSPNNSSAAGNTTATFAKPGVYHFQVTVTNQECASVTGSVDVEVVAIRTKVIVSAVNANLDANGNSVIGINGSQQFAAIMYDQFNVPMTQEAVFVWDVQSANTGDDPGTIDDSGLYTPSTLAGGTYSVSAYRQGITGTATVTVQNAPPTVAQQIVASLNNPILGTSVDLSVLGQDDGGEGNLTYAWSVISGTVAPVSFSANGGNGAKITTATFSQPGSYDIRASISDSGGKSVITLPYTVIIGEVLSHVAVTPANASIFTGGTVQFAASGKNQFNRPLGKQVTYNWSVDGGQAIDPNTGLFTAGPSTGGIFNVTALVVGISSNGNLGSATVTVSTLPSGGITGTGSLSLDLTDLKVDDASLTGDKTGELNGETVFFTNNDNVSVSVTPAVSGGTIDVLTFTAGGVMATADAGASSAVISLPSEGRYEISATATASNSDGQSVTVTTKQTAVLIFYKQKPQIALTFPARHTNDNQNDTDIVFWNGSTIALNTPLRANGTNCYNRDELKVAANITAPAGLTTKQNDSKNTYNEIILYSESGAMKDSENIVVSPATTTPQTIIANAFSSDRGKVPDSLEYKSASDKFAITNYNGRYKVHFVLTDRCGNVLDTTTESDSAILAQSTFNVWVDRIAPPAQAGENAYIPTPPADAPVAPMSTQPGVYPPAPATTNMFEWKIGKVAKDKDNVSEIFSRNAYYVVSTFDAAEGWQGSVSATGDNWMFKAYRHPTGLPHSGDVNIAMNEPSPWLLNQPVALMPGGTPAVHHDSQGNSTYVAPKSTVSVSFRDIAGNYSKSAQTLTLEMNRNFRPSDTTDNNGNTILADRDRAPQTLTEPGMPGGSTTTTTSGGNNFYSSRYFAPAVCNLPQSFVDSAKDQPFFVKHIPTNPNHPLSPSDENDPRMVPNPPPTNPPTATNAVIGIAPTDFVFTSIGSPVRYGYTDLLGIHDSYGSTGILTGSIPGSSSSITNGPVLNDRSPDSAWDFKNCLPGLGRAMETYVPTGYHWTNTIKLSPDIASTNNAVTFRLAAGFMNQSNYANYLNQPFSPSNNFIHFIRSNVDSSGNSILDANGNQIPEIDVTGTPGVVDSTKITLVTDVNNNLSQRLTFDPVNPSLVQFLDSDVQIGADVPRGLYHIEVNFGQVKAYNDVPGDTQKLNSRNQGKFLSKSHRMTNALNLIKMRFVTRDDSGNIVDLGDISNESDPYPTIPQLTADDIGLDSNGTVTLTLNGTVNDAISDIVKMPSTKVQTMQVLLNGQILTTISLPGLNSADPELPWKPYKFEPAFNLPIQFPATAPGVYSLTCRTSPNAAGNIGERTIDITIGQGEVPGTQNGGPTGSGLETATLKLLQSNTDGLFIQPGAVTVSSNNELYIVDPVKGDVQVFDLNGHFLRKWSTTGQLVEPVAISAASDSTLYILDQVQNSVYHYSSTGLLLGQWGQFGAADGQLNSPLGLAVDGSNNVYVADSGNNRIQEFTSNGQHLLTFGSMGSDIGQFNAPADILLTSTGRVAVADQGNHRVQMFSTNGDFIATFGTFGGYTVQLDDNVTDPPFGSLIEPPPSTMDRPTRLAQDSNGNIYVADQNLVRIVRFDPDGNSAVKTYQGVFDFTKVDASPIGGIASSAAALLYVCCTDQAEIARIDGITNTTSVFGGRIVDADNRIMLNFGQDADASDSILNQTTADPNTFQAITAQGITIAATLDKTIANPNIVDHINATIQFNYPNGGLLKRAMQFVETGLGTNTFTSSLQLSPSGSTSNSLSSALTLGQVLVNDGNPAGTFVPIAVKIDPQPSFDPSQFHGEIFGSNWQLDNYVFGQDPYFFARVKGDNEGPVIYVVLVNHVVAQDNNLKSSDELPLVNNKGRLVANLLTENGTTSFIVAKPFGATISSIEITSDQQDSVGNNLLRISAYHVSSFADTGSIFSGPEYQINGARTNGTGFINVPTTHTGGINLNLKVSIKVEPSDFVYYLHGEDLSGTGLKFASSAASTSTGKYQIVNVTSDIPLPNSIEELVLRIRWTITKDSDGLQSSGPFDITGPHVIYTLHGIPDQGLISSNPIQQNVPGGLTEFRVKNLATWAHGGFDTITIGNKIYDYFAHHSSAYPSFGSSGTFGNADSAALGIVGAVSLPPDAGNYTWKFFDPSGNAASMWKGQCIDMAHLLGRLVLQCGGERSKIKIVYMRPYCYDPNAGGPKLLPEPWYELRPTVAPDPIKPFPILANGKPVTVSTAWGYENNQFEGTLRIEESSGNQMFYIPVYYRHSDPYDIVNAWIDYHGEKGSYPGCGLYWMANNNTGKKYFPDYTTLAPATKNNAIRPQSGKPIDKAFLASKGAVLWGQ